MPDRNRDTAGATAPQKRKAVRSMAASGRIYFWQTGSLWLGRGEGRSEWHEHHAHQLALALEGEFRFRTEAQGPWTVFDAAVVASHCSHEFELDGATMAHLFVEPESCEGRALSQRYGAHRVSALPHPDAQRAVAMLQDAFRGNADADAMKLVARAAVATLAGTELTTPATRVGEARIARSLDYIRSRIRAPLTLADAASAASLSPSHFRHRFVAETGTSFRAYVLWLRINVAIEAAMAGASWTEAAHEAGFADSAHLSRTHKRMFGIEPTAIRHQ